MAKKNDNEGKAKRERSEMAKATMALNAAVTKRDKLRKQVEAIEERHRTVTTAAMAAEADVATARSRYEELTK